MSALPQINAYLLEVFSAEFPVDSFVNPGSGEDPWSYLKWEGYAGIFVAPIEKRKESGTDGRDIVSQRVIYSSRICTFMIGDRLQLRMDGQEYLWKIVAIKEIGQGIEAAPYFQLTIEEK